MNIHIENLLRAVPVPIKPLAVGTPEKWEQVEHKLSFELPEDFKCLIDLYGTGIWQGFWYFLNPFSVNRYLNLLNNADCVEFNPEMDRILPWALTDNGGRFFGKTNGSAETWTSIYYPDRDPDFVEVKMTTSEILLGVVSGELNIFNEVLG